MDNKYFKSLGLCILYAYVSAVAIITSIHLSVIILVEYGDLYNIYTMPAAMQFRIIFQILGFDLLLGLIIVSGLGFLIKLKLR